MAASEARADVKSRFVFTEIEAGVDDTHHVAEGYDADVLIRWGDPVLAGRAGVRPARTRRAAAQRPQFGYNNDYHRLLPYARRLQPSQHGLLVANHEYTNEELMFPGLGGRRSSDAAFAKDDHELIDIEMAAHGGSVIESHTRRRGKQGGRRRIPTTHAASTPTTPMDITGPAAGHPRLKTKDDPSGAHVSRHGQQLRRRRRRRGAPG